MPAERAGCSSPRSITTGGEAAASEAGGGTGAVGADVGAGAVAVGVTAAAEGVEFAGIVDGDADFSATGAAAGFTGRGSAELGGVNDGSWHHAGFVADRPIASVIAAMVAVNIPPMVASLCILAS